MKHLILTLALLPIASCELPDLPGSDKMTRQETLLIDAVVFVSAAEAYITDSDSPSPQPNVDPVRPPSECSECNGNGWLGDGQPRSDCPFCDRNGDGSNDDPLPYRTAELNPPPIDSDPATKEVVPSDPQPDLPEEDAVGQGNVPPPQTDWITDYQEAGVLAYKRNSRLLIVLSTEPPPSFPDINPDPERTYLYPDDLDPFRARFKIPGVYLSDTPINSEDPRFTIQPELAPLFFSEK